MHGRKRETEPPSIDVVAALKKKSDTYNSLVNIVFDRRKSNDHSIETLGLCGKMLKNNPDFSTLWNFRREILLTMYSNSINLLKDIDINSVKISNEIGSKIRDEELNLSAEGIKRNPKSYGAWYHRQWILKRFEVDYQSEFDLCKLFLKEDQRNFHCWNYRRFVAIESGVEFIKEFEFSTEKIEENFSNYSAFHHRSVYIKNILNSVNPINNSFLSELGNNNDKSSLHFKDLNDIHKFEFIQNTIHTDIDIIENAVFTEPDDQSAWWYLHFLLSFTFDYLINNPKIDNYNEKKEWFIKILLKEKELLQSLLEIEDNCKWSMLALITILQMLYTLQKGIGSANLNKDNNEELSTICNERIELINKLIIIDSVHVNRYNYLINKD